MSGSRPAMGDHEGIEAAAQVAVYIDFDNVVISRYNQLHGPDAFRNDRPGGRSAAPLIRQRLSQAHVDFGAIMDFAATIGPVAISRSYANWATAVGASYSEDMNRYSIDLVQLFPVSGTKNGADIRLAIDVIDDLSRYPHVSHVIVVAGDSDYISLAQRCKRLGRRVTGIGVDGSVSRFWELACDDFRSYHSLLATVDTTVVAIAHERVETGADLPADGHADLLVRAARLQYSTRNSDAKWIAAAGLKNLMKRLDPAFDERALGFANFTAFLRSHADIIEIEVTDSGTMVHLDPAARAPVEGETIELSSAVTAPAAGPAADEAARLRQRVFGFRRPVTADIESFAVVAVRWVSEQSGADAEFTTLPTAQIRIHLAAVGAEPEAAKVAAHVALSFAPLLLRDDDLRLIVNEDLSGASDAELVEFFRGGAVERIRGNPVGADLVAVRVAEIVHGPNGPDPGCYEQLVARPTAQEMMAAIGAILLPPQILWDIADAFVRAGDTAFPSPDVLRRELAPGLEALDRDPESIDFPAAHAALVAAGLVVAADGWRRRPESLTMQVADVSAEIIREWQQRCLAVNDRPNDEAFYRMVLPDPYHVVWRRWVRTTLGR